MIESCLSHEQEVLIEHLIDRLPVLRKKYGLSQAELGKKIGLSRQTVSAIERKATPLTWTTFLAILFLFAANCDGVFYFQQRATFKNAEMLHKELQIQVDEKNANKIF